MPPRILTATMQTTCTACRFPIHRGDRMVGNPERHFSCVPSREFLEYNAKSAAAVLEDWRDRLAGVSYRNGQRVVEE